MTRGAKEQNTLSVQRSGRSLAAHSHPQGLLAVVSGLTGPTFLFNRSTHSAGPGKGFSKNLLASCHGQAAWVAERFIVHSLKSLGLDMSVVEKLLHCCACLVLHCLAWLVLLCLV